MTSLFRFRRLAVVPALLAAAVLTLAGCSADLFSSSAPAPEGGAPADRSGGSAPEEVKPEGQPLPTTTRQIARTGAISITVAGAADAAAKLRELATAVGGFVSSENIVLVPPEGGGGRSTVVLMVPADKLDSTLDEIAKLGELKTRGVTAKDITTQVVDVEARIRTMRESIARIRVLMGKAGTLSEVAQIEAELTRRQADLESLLAQQTVLKNQVDRAPITVTLQVAGQEPDNPLVAALKQSWTTFLTSAGVLVRVIAALLPVAIVAAAILVPLIWWLRRRRAASVSIRGTMPTQPPSRPATSGPAAPNQEPPTGSTPTAG